MPSSARKAIVAASISFPRVSIPNRHSGKGSYKKFLNDLIRIQGNKAAFAVAKKAEIDAEYESQLRTLLQDESLVQKSIYEDARHSQGVGLFTRLQKQLAGETKAIAVSDEIQALNLPSMFNHPKNSKRDVFERQNYADFATKAEKRNADFKFTKESMDHAFQLEASRSGHKAAVGQKQSGVLEQTMSRCLGKESSAYWKDR